MLIFKTDPYFLSFGSGVLKKPEHRTGGAYSIYSHHTPIKRGTAYGANF